MISGFVIVRPALRYINILSQQERQSTFVSVAN